MAWNPSPKVAAARHIARQFGASQVIVLLVNNIEGTLEAVSYGRTRCLCDDAKGLADVAFDAVQAAVEGETP